MKRIAFNLRLMFFIPTAAILFSCSRENEEVMIPQATIEITKPADNALVKFGETLIIKGIATRHKDLHGYEIAIRRAGGSDLFYQHYHGHGTTITINDSWENTLNETADMELVVSVILDHELHKQNKIIKFRIQN